MRHILRYGLLLAVVCVLGMVQSGHAAMKIGVLPAADSLVLHVASDEGLFAAQGLEVELVPFQSALELGAAMRAGALDGHFGDIINVLMQNENGVPQQIIATTSRTSQTQRCFGLVVSPKSQAKTLADLQGKEIAISSATIIDYLLDALLRQQGMPSDALKRQDIRQIAVRLQMLLSGQIEAALLPEPLVSLVEARGARTILTDSGLVTPLAIIAIKKSTIDADKTAVSRFRAALQEAAIRINTDPERYRAVMLEKKLLPKDAAANYTMVRFDLQTTPNGLPSEAEVRSFADWMRTTRSLRNDLDVREVIFQ